MDFKKHPIHQSTIHQFLFKGNERELMCPKKLYHIYMLKSHKFETESMLKGSYFETLCLGSGAGGRTTNDLPRKRLLKNKELENIKRKQLNLPEHKGEKTMDQERIEEQAKKFKILCTKYQVIVTEGNTQVRIRIPWDRDKEVFLSMEFDIFPTTIMTPDNGLKMAVIDLKLTADINSQFGEYCWGAPEHMDLIQSYMYSYGVRKIAEYVEMNPHVKDILTRPAVNMIASNNISFYYWIFGYKNIEDKLLKVDWDSTKESELHEAIRKTVSLIEYYEELDWPAKPNYKLCKDCPIFDCVSRTLIQTV